MLTLVAIDGECEPTLAFTKQRLRRQLRSLFLLESSEEGGVLDCAVDDAMRRSMKCFGYIQNKYYRRDSEPCFDPFHSGQHSIFLYYLCNTISVLGSQHRSLADRVDYLNGALNGVDLYREVELPKMCLLDRSLGSVAPGRTRCPPFSSEMMIVAVAL